MYAKELADIPGLELLPWGDGASYAIYAARLTQANRRQSFLDSLRNAGVQGDTVLNYVVPDLECYRAHNYSGDAFPNALNWSQRVVNLPNHPTMTQTAVSRVIDAIKRYF